MEKYHNIHTIQKRRTSGQGKPLFVIALLLAQCLTYFQGNAQTFLDRGSLSTGDSEHLVAAARTDDHSVDLPQDYLLPSSASGYLYLRAEGADGGKSYSNNKTCVGEGGEGATIKGLFQIGTSQNMIPPGSTIRFLVGLHGEHKKSVTGFDGAGGGGGTGILFKAPNQDDWTILLVAGGGGGGCSDGGSSARAGKPGQTTENGGDGGGSNGGDGGKDALNGGRASDNGAYAGGGLFGSQPNRTSDDLLQYGDPGWYGVRYVETEATYYADGSIASPLEYGYHYDIDPQGGNGANTDNSSLWNVTGGGWGVGGGGGGMGNGGGGGGGGYSGGGGGGDYGGGGGGSYISPMAISFAKIENGTTCEPADGYGHYQITSSISNAVVHQRVRFSAKTSKCMDITNGATSNGTNMQVYDCKSTGAQYWAIRESSLKMETHMDKCLDLTSSNTANGTNIQLWECNGSSAQKWIYDVNNQFIRSSVNSNKCVALTNGITTNGNNIQLYDCKYNQYQPNQQWEIDGVTSSMREGEKLRIHFAKDPTKCLDFKNASTSDGTNVMLYNCHYTNSQYIKFDGEQIKMYSSGKCVDVKSGSTSNGANVQLYSCNNSDAQQWIYDGFTNTFRFKKDMSKCLDVSGGSTDNSTNIQIWNCNGSDAQQWYFYK